MKSGLVLNFNYSLIKIRTHVFYHSCAAVIFVRLVCLIRTFSLESFKLNVLGFPIYVITFSSIARE